MTSLRSAARRLGAHVELRYDLAGVGAAVVLAVVLGLIVATAFLSVCLGLVFGNVVTYARRYMAGLDDLAIVDRIRSRGDPVGGS